MRDNIIDENFVDELCRSGVWDIAGFNRGSINESTVADDYDEISARDLAEELFENLDESIILEFVDILYGTLLNEENDLDEGTLNEEETYQLLEDILYEMGEDDFDYLVNEAIAVLEEDYDLSEATEEDILEAVMDEITTDYIVRAAKADEEKGPRKKMQRGVTPKVRTDKEVSSWVNRRAGDLINKNKSNKSNRKKRNRKGAQLDRTAEKVGSTKNT